MQQPPALTSALSTTGGGATQDPRHNRAPSLRSLEPAPEEQQQEQQEQQKKEELADEDPAANREYQDDDQEQDEHGLILFRCTHRQTLPL
jgi:hypothetical protein